MAQVSRIAPCRAAFAYRRGMPAKLKAPPEISRRGHRSPPSGSSASTSFDRLPADRMLDVVREHVGIQAQVMSLAELQLNARLDGLRPDDVRDALWAHRRLVKTWAMRGTLHLIASDDLASFVAAAPPRGWRPPTPG